MSKTSSVLRTMMNITIDKSDFLHAENLGGDRMSCPRVL